MGLLLTLGSCGHQDNLVLANSEKHSTAREDCAGALKKSSDVLFFSSLSEEAKNNSSGINMLRVSCVLVGSRSNTQVKTILWGWKLERGAVNLGLTSMWTWGNRQVIDTMGKRSCVILSGIS